MKLDRFDFARVLRSNSSVNPELVFSLEQEPDEVRKACYSAIAGLVGSVAKSLGRVDRERVIRVSNVIWCRLPDKPFASESQFVAFVKRTATGELRKDDASRRDWQVPLAQSDDWPFRNDPHRDVSELLEHRELLDAVTSAMSRLPTHYQRAITNYVDGTPVRRNAEYGQRYRAIAALRRELPNEFLD